MLFFLFELCWFTLILLLRLLSLSSECSKLTLFFEVGPPLLLDLFECWESCLLILEEFGLSKGSFLFDKNRLGPFYGKAVAGAIVILLFLASLPPRGVAIDTDSLESSLLLTSTFKLLPLFRFFPIMVPAIVFLSFLFVLLLLLDAALIALPTLSLLSVSESKYSSLTSIIPPYFSCTALEMSDLPRKKSCNIIAIDLSYLFALVALIDAFEDLLSSLSWEPNILSIFALKLWAF